MTTSTLCLVVLAGAHTERTTLNLDALRQECDELVFIANPGARFGGFGQIANRVLDRTRCSVFGIVHADTSFATGALQTFKLAGATKIAGLVGLRANGHLDHVDYVWSRDLQHEQEVGLLDNCSVFFPVDRELRFDEVVFDSFHCNVEDLCWMASAKDIPIVVPPAHAGHAGNRTGGSIWTSDFYHYRNLLRAKHKGLSMRPMCMVLCS